MLAVSIVQRLAGFDPQQFWQAPAPRADWAAMADKYAALLDPAMTSPEVEVHRRALREAARRWPGALREAELVGPARLEQRRTLALAGTEGQLGSSRADAWDQLEPDAAAVILWAELHALLSDLQRFRRAPSHESEGSDSEAFALWVADLEAPRARWPRAERLAAVVGPRLRVRSAYLWLAARAGLDLPSLNGRLFARSGHWDQRPEDPTWARGS